MSAATAQVDELARAAAGEFVRAARRADGPNAYRIDLYRQVEVTDRALATLGRTHRVAVRIKISCESLLFEPQAGGASIVIPPEAV
jgi:hypothetical protein